ncbi:STAS domain-containing protein [Streptomyces sp. M2CJ-2]|uniref:STAS domain-containing protein n=1 Tax=Streptomyces sp. M2CJ-2 TaxID=2803948 RepID=UPI0019289EE0|nr:STAS domain-containing protein [Streptomyces sp. M2CJ-2]MBL3669152.1 STAS domain-containing protein [Streptomyces sp. M2CJ-2]
MQPEFHISHREEDDWTVVEIHGEIDIHTVPRIRDHVVHRLETGHRRLVVDLAGMTFMDSTGLWLLVGIRKRIRSRTGDLRLVITNPEVLRIFHVTGLHQVFPIHGSVESAMTE